MGNNGTEAIDSRVPMSLCHLWADVVKLEKVLQIPQLFVSVQELTVEALLGPVVEVEAEDGLPLDGDDPLGHDLVNLRLPLVAEQHVLEVDVVDFQLQSEQQKAQEQFIPYVLCHAKDI